MNRAAAWRLPAPTVRYDYAPRSWDTHPRFHLSDLGRRENFWPVVRRAFKVATVTAIGFGILYSGLSFRVRYLGDGTIRFERKADLMLATAAAAAPSLSMMGTVPMHQQPTMPTSGIPAPASRPAPVDAAPPATSEADAETCHKNREAISSAVAAYNKKFPATQVKNLAMIAQVDADLPEIASCPSKGHYTLVLKGTEPVVRCTAHK